MSPVAFATLAAPTTRLFFVEHVVEQPHNLDVTLSPKYDARRIALPQAAGGRVRRPTSQSPLSYAADFSLGAQCDDGDAPNH
jgi:hypothetical protein